MEQNTQSNESNSQAETNVGSGQIFNEPRKKSSKKIVLLIGVITIIFGAVALYFLFLSNKGNENAPVLENEKAGEIEIDKELDSDQDGLPDYIEEILGIDANNSDTDGDGYSDFEEIKNGYDPAGDEKWTEEEWEAVKGKIKDEEGLSGEVFGILSKTADWEIYRNEKYSYELKYPKEWYINIEKNPFHVHWQRVNPNADLSPFFRMPLTIVVIGRNNTDLMEWISGEAENRSVAPYEKVEDIKIGGIDVVILQDPLALSQRSEVVFVLRGNLVYKISHPIGKEVDEKADGEFRKILSTFMFIEKDKNELFCEPPINKETVCQVGLQTTFELFDEAYQNMEECEKINVPLVWGGCSLEDIFYDKEYVEKLEIESKKKSESGCWGEKIYRFKAIKKGNTEITSTGTCDYDMKYKIEIN